MKEFLHAILLEHSQQVSQHAQQSVGDQRGFFETEWILRQG